MSTEAYGVAINKDDVKELFDRVRNLEISDKVKDEKIDTLIQLTKETLVQVKDHSTTFKMHDEKEMKKYDETDKHITELNTSVQSVIAGVEDIKERTRKHEKLIYEHKQVNDETFKEIVGKQNRFIGGLGVVIALLGLLGIVFSYVSEAHKEKEVLENKLRTLEIYTNRNHAVLKNKNQGE